MKLHFKFHHFGLMQNCPHLVELIISRVCHMVKKEKDCTISIVAASATTIFQIQMGP